MNKKQLSNLLYKARIFHNHLCDEKEAIKICNRILEEHPENRDALLIKAGSLGEINKEKESFQLVTEIIKKWPNHWEAYYLMGLLLFNTNEEIAMKNFIKSINLEKNLIILLPLHSFCILCKNLVMKHIWNMPRKLIL